MPVTKEQVAQQTVGQVVSTAKDRDRRAEAAAKIVAARYGAACLKPNARIPLTPELRSLDRATRKAVAYGLLCLFRALAKYLRREQKAADKQRRRADSRKQRNRTLRSKLPPHKQRQIRQVIAARFPAACVVVRDSRPASTATEHWAIPIVRMDAKSWCGARPEASATPGQHDREQKQWARKTYLHELRSELRARRQDRAGECEGRSLGNCVAEPRRQIGRAKAVTQDSWATEFGMGAVIMPTHKTMLNARMGWQPRVTSQERRHAVGSSLCCMAVAKTKPAQTREVCGVKLPCVGATILL